MTQQQWQDGGWQNWDTSQWLRDASEFFNPVIDGLWNPDRMGDAGAVPDNPVPNNLGDAGATDPEPAPVQAQAATPAYHDNAAVTGKLFFDSPEGPSVCSATVVEDPAAPGRSNMVWTAGHCVHSGAQGGWYRNVVFVPSYNNEGLEGQARQSADQSQVIPFGTWWADWAETSPQWISEGTSSGGGGSPYDFAVLHVKPKTGTRSLQETVGAAAPVWFDAPSATGIPAVSAWGYPAALPFDGERMFSCQSQPGRMSIQPDQPTLYRIGCTMTGGASGGGWFAQNENGVLALVSNTSIGPVTNTWLAGPYLGAGAKAVYDAVSGRFGPASTG